MSVAGSLSEHVSLTTSVNLAKKVFPRGVLKLEPNTEVLEPPFDSKLYTSV